MKKLLIFKVLSLILILIFMTLGYLHLTQKSQICFKKFELSNVKKLNTSRSKKSITTSKVLKELNKNKNICILSIEKDKNNACVKISYNNTVENLQKILEDLYEISSFKTIKQLNIKKGKDNNINTYLEVEFT